MVDKQEALGIAKRDAEIVYGDLKIYEVKANLRGDKWYVDYDLIDPNLHGGGPHYVISATTGEILERRYEQ